jgi:plastocyanin
MGRLGVAIVAIALLSGGCAGGSGERTVLVDYSYDEFATFFAHNFPTQVTVAQGDTVVFKQTWTGEPHTVSGGKIADRVLTDGARWLRFFEAYDGLRARGVALPDSQSAEGPNPPKATWAEILKTAEGAEQSPLRTQFFDSYEQLVKENAPLPDRAKAAGVTFVKVVQDVDKATNKLFDKLLFAYDEEAGTYRQSVAQPCFLKEGLPPEKPAIPCAKSSRVQPVFDGTHNFYSSGIIPYQGAQGNTYTVKLSPNIKPGKYYFYCAVHGPGQRTELTVKPKGTKVPSQAEMSKRADDEIRTLAKPLVERFRDAQDGKVEIDGRTVEGPFAGLSAAEESSINEFIPKTVRTKVGQKVTWKISGADHSISFDVPKYFPIIRFAKDGTVSHNPLLDKPAGGSPKIPEGKEGEIPRVDGGTYSGSGFFSSSVFGGQPYAEYSLRFAKPGTYRLACLIHPPMVGTVVVTI